MPYRGRFAPSPTGPLHIGSLVSAVASYLEARANQGEWHVRIEDLDPPREMPGASDLILRTLDIHGFEWDGDVCYQSQRSELYESALQELLREGQAYPCGCSRTDIAQALGTFTGIQRYPGTCRQGLPRGRKPRALRVRTESRVISFTDALQGLHVQNVFEEVGDFVIKRADNQFAYQLAVVVDDHAQGITDVVRGSDLLSSTPRQIYLQSLLRLPTPTYTHVAVITNQRGEKLSKQTHAKPLDLVRPQIALVQALDYLGQNPPEELRNNPLQDVWQWAFRHWRIENVVKQETICEHR